MQTCTQAIMYITKLHCIFQIPDYAYRNPMMIPRPQITQVRMGHLLESSLSFTQAALVGYVQSGLVEQALQAVHSMDSLSRVSVMSDIAR